MDPCNEPTMADVSAEAYERMAKATDWVKSLLDWQAKADALGDRCVAALERLQSTRGNHEQAIDFTTGDQTRP